MKKITSLYSLTLAVLLMLTACQSDNIEEQGGAQNSDGKALVTLRIATDNGKADTRALWEDTNAKAYTDRTEMMNSWIVLITDGSKIVKKFTGAPDLDKAEIDDVCQNEPIAAGTYSAYSFANISENSLASILGVESLEPNTALTDAMVTGAKASVNGNDFDPTADNNGFGSKGIPMSNKQTLTVPASGTLTKDLIVVRMLAKIEVQVFNDGTESATIESISLTDITANVPASGADNLKLLPNYGTTPNYPDDMDANHMDIQPNLASGASRGNFTFTPTSGNVVAATGHKSTGTGQTPVIFTFYVNESIAPNNGSELFYLSLGIKTGTGDDVVYSHALISNTETNEWSYIARNDYRVIPVILTDWLFRVEPMSLPPIGGYPTGTASSDGLKVTFNAGGMIALQPFVKKRTESNWRDFGNAEVNPGVEVTTGDPATLDVEASWNASITWKNSNGTKQSGNDCIIKTPFTYDSANKCFVGELNSDKVNSGQNKTAVTITVKLGPPDGAQFTYSFTCDVNI
ncbi:MAG: hypothetical protein IKO86_01600 [Prevotella sp.]|nr:hypothetical protein [Prevotella sp.]